MRVPERAHMKDHLAVIRAGKEILTQPGHEREDQTAGDEKHGDKERAARDQQRQDVAIPVAERGEALLEALLCAHQRIARGAMAVRLGFQEIHRHGRHQSSR